MSNLSHAQKPSGWYETSFIYVCSVCREVYDEIWRADECCPIDCCPTCKMGDDDEGSCEDCVEVRA